MESINDNPQEYGQLGVIALESSKELGKKVDEHLKKKRGLNPEHSYLVPIKEIRFSNGEGKVQIEQTVRGKDIYIVCDVGNYSCTYELFGYKNHKGPDEHFQDIKRVLSAIGGKARRITVVMPLLYASRQHRRKGRESLDCALALQELERLGVEEIITFDVHDPNIQNAVPLVSFTNLYPTYDIVKHLITEDKNLFLDKSSMVVISPDTGAMDRAIYYSSILGCDVGLFYKRRDHSVVVNGKNPIVQHEYIGKNIEGLNVLIVDDMIASGESVFDIVVELKKRKAKNIYVAATFGFFTEGPKKFQKLYDDGMISKVYCTNLTYVPDKVKNAEWFKLVDISNFISAVINNLNHDVTISNLRDATEGIKTLLKEMNS